MRRGEHMPDEMRTRISAAKMGHEVSVEARAKISTMLKRRAKRLAYMRDYGPKHYLANKEKYDEQHRLYDLAHPEERRQRVAKWQHDNPEAYHAAEKKWRDANPEEQYRLTEQWCRNNPIAAKKIRAKKTAKRRTLGFIPMNTPFLGADAHHLDRERVAYIPHILHMSVKHNVWTGKNMECINDVAYKFLFKQEVEAAMAKVTP